MTYSWTLLFGVIGSLIIQSECNTECTIWGKTISDIRSGRITNPSPTNTRTTCTWTFKVQSSQVLQLNFTRFDLVSAHQCQFAYVQIESKNGKFRYCGKTRPPVGYYKGPQDVELEYKFDTSSKLKEFSLEYRETKAPNDQCREGNLKCMNGRCLSQDVSCNGVDDCGDGTDESACGHKASIPSDCGRPKVEPEPGNGDRIVGGTEVIPGSWPWQVSIQRSSIFPSGHFCGGSLVNDMWIVSAGHCFTSITAEDIRIKLGDHRPFLDDEGEIVRYAEKIIIHPSYRRDVKDQRNDIALIKLKAPVQYSDTISPVCLPKDGEVPSKTMLHVTGWGRTSGVLTHPIETTATFLKQAMVPMMTWKQCYSELVEKLARETICVSFGEDGIGPCLGDSGGPLVGQTNETNKWTLYGVVSWGQATCDFSTAPAVFTKVSSYIPWIQETISRN